LEDFSTYLRHSTPNVIIFSNVPRSGGVSDCRTGQPRFWEVGSLGDFTDVLHLQKSSNEL